jgi:hypothetical protein
MMPRFCNAMTLAIARKGNESGRRRYDLLLAQPPPRGWRQGVWRPKEAGVKLLPDSLGSSRVVTPLVGLTASHIAGTAINSMGMGMGLAPRLKSLVARNGRGHDRFAWRTSGGIGIDRDEQ